MEKSVAVQGSLTATLLKGKDLELTILTNTGPLEERDIDIAKDKGCGYIVVKSPSELTPAIVDYAKREGIKLIHLDHALSSFDRKESLLQQVVKEKSYHK